MNHPKYHILDKILHVPYHKQDKHIGHKERDLVSIKIQF